MAASNYAVEFGAQCALSERVLWPAGPAESHGMEDARFVRFTDGEDATYYATYTAFDGSQVAPHLLETTRLPDLHRLPALRSLGQEQGHGAVSAADRGPLRRPLPLGQGK